MNTEALNEYLDSKRHSEFVWGKNDCLTFSNDAFHAMYGEGWCDDWLGRYMRGKNLVTNEQLKVEFGFDSLEEGLATKLKKIEYVPPRGALVTMKAPRRFLLGQSFGISDGTRAVFLMNKGLLYHPIQNISGAWVKE